MVGVATATTNLAINFHNIDAYMVLHALQIQKNSKALFCKQTFQTFLQLRKHNGLAHKRTG